MIAGDVAGVAVVRAARRVREAVPDARPRPVRERRALDLVGGRRRAPQKARGEARGGGGLFTHASDRCSWPR